MSNRIGGFRQKFERNFDRASISDVAQADGNVQGKGKGKGKAGAAPPSSEGLGATAPKAYDPSIPPPGSVTHAQVAVIKAMMDAYHSNQDDIMTKGKSMVASQACADQMSAASAALTSANANVAPPLDPNSDNPLEMAQAADREMAYLKNNSGQISQQQASAQKQLMSNLESGSQSGNPLAVAQAFDEYNTTVEGDVQSDFNYALANGVHVQVVPDNSPQADTIDGDTAYITESQMQALESNSVTIPQGEKIDSTSLSNLLSSINNAQEQMNSNTEYTMLQMQTDTQNQNQDASMATGLLKSIGASITTAATDFD